MGVGGMLVKEYRCDICNCLLVDNVDGIVIRSFRNLKIKLRKYQICEDCKKEIIEAVKKNRQETEDE